MVTLLKQNKFYYWKEREVYNFISIFVDEAISKLDGYGVVLSRGNNIWRNRISLSVVANIKRI